MSRNMAGPLHTVYLREGELVGEDGWGGLLCVCVCEFALVFWGLCQRTVQINIKYFLLIHPEKLQNYQNHYLWIYVYKAQEHTEN